MFLSVFGAVLVALAMWYFGRFHGSTGMAVSLMVINLVYGLPSALWLWLRLRKTWHHSIGAIHE
jgi:phage-related holin